MRPDPEARPHLEAAAALATLAPIFCEVADSISPPQKAAVDLALQRLVRRAQ